VANSGVIIWNNPEMIKIDFIARCVDVFSRVNGSAEGDEDLLTITALVHRIPFFELPYEMNYSFGASLSSRLKREFAYSELELENVYLTH
jgi:hypothetical protein